MKVQIRRGVFETNSSSTHSLQITHGTIDDVKDIVYKAIFEQYKDNMDCGIFNPKDYIIEHKFILRGIDFENGDEMTNIYYIINNWVAKLQYIAMELNNNAYYIEDYNRAEYRNHYFEDNHDDWLEDTEVYKKFVEYIKKIAKQHGYDIQDVKNQLEYGSYVEFTKNTDTNKKFFENIGENGGWLTVEKFNEYFWNIMDDNNTITYADEAYAPYYKPKIYII